MEKKTKLMDLLSWIAVGFIITGTVIGSIVTRKYRNKSQLGQEQILEITNELDKVLKEAKSVVEESHNSIRMISEFQLPDFSLVLFYYSWGDHGVEINWRSIGKDSFKGVTIWVKDNIESNPPMNTLKPEERPDFTYKSEDDRTLTIKMDEFRHNTDFNMARIDPKDYKNGVDYTITVHTHNFQSEQRLIVKDLDKLGGGVNLYSEIFLKLADKDPVSIYKDYNNTIDEYGNPVK